MTLPKIVRSILAKLFSPLRNMQSVFSVAPFNTVAKKFHLGFSARHTHNRTSIECCSRITPLRVQAAPRILLGCVIPLLLYRPKSGSERVSRRAFLLVGDDSRAAVALNSENTRNYGMRSLVNGH